MTAGGGAPMPGGMVLVMGAGAVGCASSAALWLPPGPTCCSSAVPASSTPWPTKACG